MKEKKEKYVNGEKENFLQSEMNEICKNLNKLRKDYEGKWDQFEQGEITLRTIISFAMLFMILDEMGDELRYVEPEMKMFSVDWNEEIPLEGVLIKVIKENKRFRVIIKNTKGQIETYPIPEKAVKVEFNWRH